MFIEIIKKNDDSYKEELEVGSLGTIPDKEGKSSITAGQNSRFALCVKLEITYDWLKTWNFFERETLTDLNFNDWYRSLRIVLRVADTFDYLYKPCPGQPVDTATEAEKAAFKAEYKKHSDVACIMLEKFQPALHKAFQTALVKPVCEHILEIERDSMTITYTRKPYDKKMAVNKRSTSSLNKDFWKNPNKDTKLSHCHVAGIGRGTALLYRRVRANKKKSKTCAISLSDLKRKETILCGIKICSGNGTQAAVKPRNDLPILQDPAMQKLHREGLLENIDEESFDKCESCISGKMTKKPFNKNIERATDLLGLIHTDVCGPLRHVSRKGASYFLTFTDDFSRYGYVYLLKHKHEVFETFKVFKAEVELQLGKKIKALRSDRGGEYLSQELIVQNLTSPYTPQQNGVSERRNRTLLDMVRSMFNLTTLPLSFWDYALESAVRILNMVPTKKVDKTPYEICNVQSAKLSYIKVRGVASHIVKTTQLIKLQ
ncbi:retrotransposon protein, putative, ty1-copia subclass [Tanacetum coccineum]